MVNDPLYSKAQIFKIQRSKIHGLHTVQDDTFFISLVRCCVVEKWLLGLSHLPLLAEGEVDPLKPVAQPVAGLVGPES